MSEVLFEVFGVNITITAVYGVVSVIVLLLFMSLWLAGRKKRSGREIFAGQVMNGIGFGLLPALAVLKAFQEAGTGAGAKVPEPLPYIRWLSVGGYYMPGRIETAAACASFMQVSGLKYTVNTANTYDRGEPYGDNWFTAASLSRVTIDEVNGQPFDAEATYAVITSNANFNGMDSSYIIKAAAEANEKSTVTTAVVRDVVWMYLSEALENVVGEDYAEPQGRIVIE